MRGMIGSSSPCGSLTVAFQREKPVAIGIKGRFYPVQLHIANQEVKVFAHRGNDWTKRFTKVADAAS